MKMSKNVREAAEFIVAIVVAVLFYIGLGLVLGTSMPLVAVVSDSMEPTLHVGDLMIVHRPDTYNIGDIALYPDKEGKTIIHRIVDVSPQGYIFQGDNRITNDRPDPFPVPESRILGRARFAIPLLGYPRLVLFAVGI